jgi:hypothetical protein
MVKDGDPPEADKSRPYSLGGVEACVRGHFVTRRRNFSATSRITI